MFKPWTVVSDHELQALRTLKEHALKLQRGCWCDYDYRCGVCQRIVDIIELARKVEGEV